MSWTKNGLRLVGTELDSGMFGVSMWVTMIESTPASIAASKAGKCLAELGEGLVGDRDPVIRVGRGAAEAGPVLRHGGDARTGLVALDRGDAVLGDEGSRSPKARMPSAMFSGLVLTSTTGALSTLIPIAASSRPVIAAFW